MTIKQRLYAAKVFLLFLSDVNSAPKTSWLLTRHSFEALLTYYSNGKLLCDFLFFCIDLGTDPPIALNLKRIRLKALVTSFLLV